MSRKKKKKRFEDSDVVSKGGEGNKRHSQTLCEETEVRCSYKSSRNGRSLVRAAAVGAGWTDGGQPVGRNPSALQDGGRGPHYISLHVGPLSLSPKRLFCLFREPEPF